MLCFRCGSYNPESAQKCTVCGQSFFDASGRAIGPARRESKAAPPASIFVPGDVVAGRYRVGELQGQGPVGSVYRARDTKRDVDVALKVVTPNLLQTEEEQRNFSRQLKDARRLQHPNIVRVYDEGAEGTRRFFTMKLLEGLTLRKIIRLRHDKGEPFAAEELGPIMQQLAAALDYAHQTTWHGDLKPENIIILPDLLKITDFNLVQALPLKPFLGVVKSRSKGFPYIAPEVRVEAQHIDGRADIYALGVILAEMLTGLVYEGHFTRAMTAALEHLPSRLDGLVRRALTEHPDGRIPTAGELSRELDDVLASLSGPLPPPAVTPDAPPSASSSIPAPARRGTPAPKETGLPRAGAAPPPVPSSDSSAEPLSASSEEGVVEVAESQVLMLESAVVQQPPELIEEVARRLEPIGAGNGGVSDDDVSDGGESDGGVSDDSVSDDSVSDDSVSDDTVTDGPVATAPGDLPPGSELTADEGGTRSSRRQRVAQGARDARRHLDATLLPPPLPPDVHAVDHSQDHPVVLPGDDDLGPTDAGASTTSDDESTGPVPSARRRGAGAIHEAETALNRPALEPVEAPGRMELGAPRSRTAAASTGAPEDVAEGAPQVPSATGRRPRGVVDAPPPLVATTPPVTASPQRSRSSSRGALLWGALVGMVALGAGMLLWRAPTSDVAQGAEGTERAAAPALEGPSATANASATVSAADGEAPAQQAPTAPSSAGAPEARGADGAGAVADAPGATRPDPGPGRTVRSSSADLGAAPAATASSAQMRQAPAATGTRGDAAQKPSDDNDNSAGRVAAILKSETATSTANRQALPSDAAPRVAAVAVGTCPRGMALIPSGSFIFGSSTSDPMRNFGEATASPVDVEAFCIDYYEQPNGKDVLPTTGVSWQAAKNACERAGRRLCTEREWERACKGDASARFPYGNTYDADVCNTEDADGNARKLASATSFKRCRSPFKVFMMSGNAEEWVADAAGGQRVAKGGAADRPDFSSRCSARRPLAPRTTTSTLGFRCCATPVP